MKNLFTTTAAIALLSASCVFADAGVQVPLEAEAPSDVLVLTDKTFDKEINPVDLALVEFYAPWCGHCKKLAPHYEEAATALKKEGIVLAKVDCTVEREVCEKFEVRGYPTLKIFRKGQHSDYSGERVKDAIVKHMQVQALPAISQLKSEDVETFSTSDKVVVVAFFSDAESKEFKELSAVADQLRDDYRFGATFDAEVAKKFGADVPGLILFKKFDEGKNVFADAYTEEAISSFVKTHAIPLMDDIGPDNYAKFMESPLPLAYLFVSTDSERTETGPKVEAVAKELKGKMNFVYIDAIKYGAHAENVNLNPDSWPAFAIQNQSTQAKYPFDQAKEITTEAIKEFAQGVLDGTTKPKIKSEPTPAENDGPVKIVTGNTFEEISKDTKKDVLLEFYAPWCGHCQKLEPIYESLGKLYQAAEDIVIAKLDATKNDHAGVEVTGFPTLKLFKAGTNEVIDYEGDRSKASLIEFITKNAASSFKAVDAEPSEPEASSEEEEDADHAEHDEL